MSNIQIVGDILQTNQLERLSASDIKLLQSSNIGENFGQTNDYIEYHIIDSAGNLQSSDYNYKNFKLATNSSLEPISGGLPALEIDPIADLQNTGYTSGEFTTQYNFFRNRLSDTSAGLYISEISSDRTELRLASNSIPNDIITGSVLNLIEAINDLNYYQDILLNFGSNQQYLVTNVILDTTTQFATILVKLYQPLSTSFQVKDTLWIVEEIIDAQTFDINFDQFILPDPIPQLRGPNFNIEIKDKNHKTTSYENYTTLISEISASSQLVNYLNDKGVLLSIDYTDYNNFIHFSSAKSRITNFYGKVKQIQDYTSFINSSNLISGSTPNIINDISNANSSITDILTKFDQYENYLYYQSSSYAFPKTTSSKPYILQSTGSSESISWYTNTLISGSLYDLENLDNLINTIPDFIRDDSNNNTYIVFINMIGHYFDTIWIYLDSITSLWNNSNNSNEGVSKDLVQYMLKSLGVDLYNNESTDLSTYLVGANSGSNSINNTTDRELLEETYRRLYHNIPYLTKAKGTLPGLRALISCFGIPQNILDINEYGGNNKTNNFEISQISQNKIRIIDNNITGSVLSPLITIEDTPDTLLLEDLPYIDISFNPSKPLNNHIETVLSGSFNIDNYIGDPGYALSSSYTSLNQFKQTYYGSYFSKFNYTKYTNLISYFDNSLFKMVQDFVPARANTSIGLLIESPIFERNKVARHNPQVTTSSYYANYPTASIVNDNTYLWSQLSGSRKPFYNGEISGSFWDVNKQFKKENINPFLNHTQSFSKSEFRHSEFNILLNNISSSRQSKIRISLEPLYSGSIIIGRRSQSFANIQDTDLSLTSYQRSRYSGTKVYSQQYNNYTSSSLGYGGDQSFGQTAAIDYNVIKLGLLTQVTESQFLPKRNNITIKYLVDSSGSLTELNQNNKNWEEVQNTFKAGDNLAISLFDNQKFGNQRSTDGSKFIFNSGYSYYPTMYFSSSDNSVYFDFEQTIKSGQFKAIIVGNNIDNNAYHYNTSSGLFYDIFNDISNTVGGFNDSGNYILGTANTASHYIVPSTGLYSFQIDSQILATAAAQSQSTTLTLQVSSSDGQLSGPLYLQTSSFTSNTVNGSITLFNRPNPPLGTTRRFISIQEYDLTGPINVMNGVTLAGIATGSVILEYTRAEDVDGMGNVVNAFTFNLAVVPSSLFGLTDFIDPPINFQNNISNTFDLSINTPALTYASGTQIYFSLKSNNFTNFTYQAIGGFAESQLQSGTPEIDGGNFITNISTTAITLESQFATFLNNYIYLPQSSSLYSLYGDVDYSFGINPGDLLILTDNNGVKYEININSYNVISGLNLVSSAIPSGLSTGSIAQFLLLKKVQDETNIIVNYIKKPGQTSLGLTIPSNLDKGVLSNIDTITSEVKSKLIDLGVSSS